MTEHSPLAADVAEVRTRVERGDHEGATIAAIRAYGPELVGWLSGTLRSEADAHDAFSRMSEQLWRSLPTFDARCSVRAWCYMLARQAAARVRSGARYRHEVLVSQVPSLGGVVSEAWSTRARAEHQAANIYAEIRRELDEDDQTLLVLRVDRKLEWRDIAQVLLGEDATAADVARSAAALRKQFERVKQRLRKLVAERLGE
jgi:DNA-directed RNA polymerase specialized sigma24 family protein